MNIILKNYASAFRRLKNLITSFKIKNNTLEIKILIQELNPTTANPRKSLINGIYTTPKTRTIEIKIEYNILELLKKFLEKIL